MQVDNNTKHGKTPGYSLSPKINVARNRVLLTYTDDSYFGTKCVGFRGSQEQGQRIAAEKFEHLYKSGGRYGKDFCAVYSPRLTGG